MNRHICADSTLVLSYDAAFLALVRLAATGEETRFSKRRCFLHPVKKRLMLEDCEALRYSASVGALLAYHKAADDAADEGGLKNRLFMLEANRLRRRAKMTSLDNEIAKRLFALYSEEREALCRGNASIDKLAELSGAVTSYIFEYGLDGRAARVSSELGRRIGRWVYIIDAAADFERDLRNKTFNPFLYVSDSYLPRGYGGSDSAREPIREKDSKTEKPAAIDLETVAASLILERKAAENALNLLGCADAGIEEILRNIITIGMSGAEEKLLNLTGAAAKSETSTGYIL